MNMQNGIDLITKERRRQIEEKNYSIERDRQRYLSGELLAAANAYSGCAEIQAQNPDAEFPTPPSNWPWPADSWRPEQDPLCNLTKAGALIAAEIDRILSERSVKVKCVAYTHPDFEGKVILLPDENITDTVGELNRPELLQREEIEMTQYELENLPEWDG